MLGKNVTTKEALYLVDLESEDKLEQAIKDGLVKPVKGDNKKDLFALHDLVTLKLALSMVDLGLAPGRAIRYAEATLGVGSTQAFNKTMAWIDGETHELFCLLADKQLSRIFLRGIDDNREIDVGAEKPVLFPVSKCELN
ncbi:MAG: hypothetical protein QG663_1337, partial [Thermodesulfobacteriota bacterium]|nr:hypothetical protein [Thermodesulfobacteriota bacterium]